MQRLQCLHVVQLRAETPELLTRCLHRPVQIDEMGLWRRVERMLIELGHERWQVQSHFRRLHHGSPVSDPSIRNRSIGNWWGVSYGEVPFGHLPGSAHCIVNSAHKNLVSDTTAYLPQT